METASAKSLMPIKVAIIGSQGLIVAALTLMAFRVGRFPSREESNALRDEVTANKMELKEDVAAVKLEILNAKAELRQEITDAKEEVLREIRRSHQQLILALVNHTHNANGHAVFTLPPETEPAPADN